MKKTKVMIIGTGPYGISIAQDLFEQNIDFVISGHIFSLWYRHTLDTMAIRSDWHTSEIFTRKNRYSIISFLDANYPGRTKEIIQSRIPIDIFRHYLKDVEEKLPFPVQNSKTVSVEENGKGGLFQLLKTAQKSSPGPWLWQAGSDRIFFYPVRWRIYKVPWLNTAGM